MSYICPQALVTIREENNSWIVKNLYCQFFHNIYICNLNASSVGNCTEHEVASPGPGAQCQRQRKPLNYCWSVICSSVLQNRHHRVGQKTNALDFSTTLVFTYTLSYYHYLLAINYQILIINCLSYAKEMLRISANFAIDYERSCDDPMWTLMFHYPQNFESH